MTMRQVYDEIRGLKVMELPNYVKPMMSVRYIKKAIERGLDKYHAKYTQTSRYTTYASEEWLCHTYSHYRRRDDTSSTTSTPSITNTNTESDPILCGD